MSTDFVQMNSGTIENASNTATSDFATGTASDTATDGFAANTANISTMSATSESAEATEEDTRTPEEIFREARESVVNCLNANHANTLALIEVLKHCPEARPYREVEEELYDLPAMSLTHQNPHTLSLMLVKAGGLEQIMVEEDPEEQIDQPTDYLLCITPAGQAALEDFEPVNRFSRLTADEPSTYRALYRKVLGLCDGGAKTSSIEDALEGEDAMRDPKQVYPGYFISKLETVGAINWENKSWKTTESGTKLAAAL